MRAAPLVKMSVNINIDMNLTARYIEGNLLQGERLLKSVKCESVDSLVAHSFSKGSVFLYFTRKTVALPPEDGGCRLRFSEFDT